MKIKNKKWLRMEMSQSGYRYNKDVLSIAIAGLMIAIVMLAAWVTSNISFPKIPLIGGRPDFWYGIAVIAMVFIPDWKYRILYVLALPFALMPSELRGAEFGMYDYFLEWMCPMFALFLMIPLMKNKIMLLMQVFIVISIYMALKLLFSTYAGVKFYKLSWKPSLIYNWPNTLLDWGISMTVAPLTLLKLIKIRK